MKADGRLGELKMTEQFENIWFLFIFCFVLFYLYNIFIFAVYLNKLSVGVSITFPTAYQHFFFI